MIALLRQHMRERIRVIGLIGRTRKNPDVLENPREPEILPGTSNQGQTRRTNPPEQKSSRKTRGESDRTRDTRPSTNRGYSAVEGRPVRSRRKPTGRPCPYYLGRRVQTK
ncbi:hypothetical protein TNCV_5088921 [Trichonephila clavipes]|nr:hypothetical protein TNCV_5088921 [Trichonephila clavipes]